MQHTDALKRLAALFRRSASTPDLPTDPDAFSGPTLLQQEPDLAQETARYSVTSSSWAAAGHPVD